MEIIAYTSLLAYVLFYLPIIWANRRAKEKTASDWTGKEKCSLIIPFYNEATVLPRLIESLLESTVQADEIVLVDDYSTDDSYAIAQSLSDGIANMRCVRNSNLPGKKNALTYGIEHARNNIIVTTDADCIMHPNWLKKLVGSHVTDQNDFTFGLVEYISDDHWLGLYQWMESRALMASGIGLFRLKKPVMCNGANLVFNKNAWQSVGGYEKQKSIEGGDDIFLMHALWKKNPECVGYCLNEEAVVFTSTHRKFGKFMRQRKRWAQKTGHYEFAFANIIPFVVAGVNLLILIGFIVLLKDGEIWLAFWLLISKAFVDYYNIISLKEGFKNCVSFIMIMQYQLFQLTYPIMLPFFRSDWRRRSK